MPFDESTYQRVRCTADTPVIRLSQGQQKAVTITLRDEQGDEIDLTQYAGDPTFASSSSVAGVNSAVKLAASHCLNGDNVLFTLDGTITSGETGEVVFAFTPTETKTPGIFVASVGVFRDNILRFNQMFYLEFMPTNFTINSGGPITVPEVRMELRDQCSDANYLIDELEYTDAEIIHCMRKAVDVFNETNPPVGSYAYDKFPFRANWLKGTVAFLLQMMAHSFRRNALQYNAGGLSVADQEKYREYAQVGKQLENEYVNWCQRKRVEINMGLGYRAIGPSPYGR